MNNPAPIELLPFQYFYNLEDSLPYDKFRYRDYKEMEQLTEEIWSEMAFRKNRKEKWLTLFNILCNLKYALEQLKAVAVSLNKEYYRTNDRYFKLGFNYYDTVAVILELEKSGFIHVKKGYFDRKKGEGKNTRVWASRELAVKLLKFETVCFRDESHKEDLILVRNKAGTELTYPETEFTLELKARLQAYNEFMREVKAEFINIPYNDVFIGLVKSIQPKLPEELRCSDSVITDYKALSKYVKFHQQLFSQMQESREQTANPEEAEEKAKTEEKTLEEISKLYQNDSTIYVYTQLLSRIGKITEISFGLKAVFSRKSFFMGGRLYSGANGWQCLNEQQRATITLNGEPTVELDFSALHINMLYAKEKLQYEKDPYDVVCEDKTMRPALKTLLLVAINTRNDEQTINALSRKTDRILVGARQGKLKTIEWDFYNAINGRSVNWEYWLTKFKKEHTPIARHFCNDSGIKLMNQDSKIIMNVVDYCVQNRIPCLPVHDSVIVPEQRKNEIEKVMKDAYRKEMGFDCKIK